VAVAQSAAPSCPSCLQWKQRQAPFRIYSNPYYVGPHGLGSILVTSDAGHVLIDGGLAESARQIAANVRSLGFRIEDVELTIFWQTLPSQDFHLQLVPPGVCPGVESQEGEQCPVRRSFAAIQQFRRHDRDARASSE